jgi:S-DNA-T family DNA segregation ATPase FtsK/SpoIIIE
MAAAARRTGSQLIVEALRGAWDHAAAARFRGGLTAALGGALVLALATWRPDDPSLDASSAARAANLLGGPGADIADLAMQALGLSAWLVAALLLILGLARAAHPEPSATRGQLRWRAAAGVGGVVLLAGGLAGAAPPAIWPLAAGLGGLVGDAQAALLGRIAKALDFSVLAPVTETLLALSGLWLAGVALGIRPAHFTALLHWRPGTRAGPLGP